MSQLGELKLQSSIDRRIGNLVETAEKLIVDRAGKIRDKDVGASQIRNVMAVANSAPHIAVVTNFIRYQMGRSTTKPTWKDTGLGDAVNDAIQGTVGNMAKDIVAEAGFGEIDETQMRLTRLLLGFMHRSYVYEADKLKSAAQAGRQAPAGRR